ncbi:MAG: hypothetical protein NC115_05865 [Bacteroidales bacterium]|nr:hypothetical protein [Bacteroides sp.]MCM1198493.1 hypothetical protein [Clostridium sp.]MCM1502176.1 hypothetical protein [Bacteroidales bacterium]
MLCQKPHRLTVQLVAGVIVTFAGMALLYIGCFLPPAGIIDPSVLVGFGETATFAGALIGVDYHYRYKEDSNGNYK